MWGCGGVCMCVQVISTAHAYVEPEFDSGVLCHSPPYFFLKGGPSLKSGNASLARLAGNLQALSVFTVCDLALG